MSDAANKQPKDARRPRVLVVDDDPIVLAVARERLASAGYDVSVREEVLGTTRWLVSHPADCLLLDVMMPALDGSELAALLKQRTATRDIIVILHSSMGEIELAEVASKIGAAGYISKSVDARTFIEQFRRIIARNAR